VLDLEVRGGAVPRLYVDVTVRHSVPGDAPRLSTAACQDGAAAREAEADKRARYPDGRTPYRVLPFALETFGRFGKTALLHLRGLAKQQAQRLEEGGAEAASSLTLRWGCRLSVALQRANATNVRRAIGDDVLRGVQKQELASNVAG